MNEILSKHKAPGFGTTIPKKIMWIKKFDTQDLINLYLMMQMNSKVHYDQKKVKQIKKKLKKIK